MKKFLIEFIVLYVASLIIFALVAAIIPGVEATRRKHISVFADNAGRYMYLHGIGKWVQRRCRR